MPINIIRLEDAKRKPFKGNDPSPVKSTKTYNEVADLIRSGNLPVAISISFSDEELTRINLKFPYSSLRRELAAVIDKYQPGKFDLVDKQDHVTIHSILETDNL